MKTFIQSQQVLKVSSTNWLFTQTIPVVRSEKLLLYEGLYYPGYHPG